MNPEGRSSFGPFWVLPKPALMTQTVYFFKTRQEHVYHAQNQADRIPFDIVLKNIYLAHKKREIPDENPFISK